MDISAVILTFNSQAYIRRCLDDLISSLQSLKLKFEIFIIDNGSKDETRKIIREIMGEQEVNPITLIEFDYNTGTTFSRNQGLGKASGENIIILDSDAYVNPEAISRLRTYLNQNDGCGMAVPKITYPDGRFQISTDSFPTLMHKVKRFLFLKKMESRDVAIPTEPLAVDYAISAFWMFPQSVMKKIGMLDEKIFYSPEDVDYCIRVWKAGYRIDYVPDVTVIHDAQEISRPKGFRINKFTLSHLKGLFYLFLKHRYFFYPRKFRRLTKSPG